MPHHHTNQSLPVVQDRISIMAHALLAQAPGDDVGSVLSLQDLRLREITRYK